MLTRLLVPSRGGDLGAPASRRLDRLIETALNRHRGFPPRAIEDVASGAYAGCRLTPIAGAPASSQQLGPMILQLHPLNREYIADFFNSQYKKAGANPLMGFEGRNLPQLGLGRSQSSRCYMVLALASCPDATRRFGPSGRSSGSSRSSRHSRRAG